MKKEEDAFSKRALLLIVACHAVFNSKDLCEILRCKDTQSWESLISKWSQMSDRMPNWQPVPPRSLLQGAKGLLTGCARDAYPGNFYRDGVPNFLQQLSENIDDLWNEMKGGEPAVVLKTLRKRRFGKRPRLLGIPPFLAYVIARDMSLLFPGRFFTDDDSRLGPYAKVGLRRVFRRENKANKDLVHFEKLVCKLSSATTRDSDLRFLSGLISKYIHPDPFCKMIVEHLLCEYRKVTDASRTLKRKRTDDLEYRRLFWRTHSAVYAPRLRSAEFHRCHCCGVERERLCALRK